MILKGFWEDKDEGQRTSINDEEKEEMLTMKNREFLIENEGERRAIGLGLLDLLLAFVYDYRMTSGDPTVESCWTVTILSPSLSWLETYRGENKNNHTVAAVIRTFFRRSLTYPYLRMWTLTQKCVDDVKQIVSGGRRVILRCLLRVKKSSSTSSLHVHVFLLR